METRVKLPTLVFRALLLSLSFSTKPAQAASAARGLNFARVNCGSCHSLDRRTPSPLAIAPPFRELHKRYPVETLEEALSEGIVTGHPTMPEFTLDSGQIGDFVAFLKSLE